MPTPSITPYILTLTAAEIKTTTPSNIITRLADELPKRAAQQARTAELLESLDPRNIPVAIILDMRPPHNDEASKEAVIKWVTDFRRAFRRTQTRRVPSVHPVTPSLFVWGEDISQPDREKISNATATPVDFKNEKDVLFTTEEDIRKMFRDMSKGFFRTLPGFGS